MDKIELKSSFSEPNWNYCEMINWMKFSSPQRQKGHGATRRNFVIISVKSFCSSCRCACLPFSAGRQGDIT